MTVFERAFESLSLRRAGRIARLLREYVEPGESVLDIGCGRSIVAERLQAEAGVRIFGLETLRYRQRLTPMVLYAGETAPFRDDSFDTVLISFVLHHCADGGTALLREAKRLARRRILLLEEGYEHALERVKARIIDRVLNHLENPAVPTPYRFRTNGEWRRLFNDMAMPIQVARTVRTTPIIESRQVLFVLAP